MSSTPRSAKTGRSLTPKRARSEVDPSFSLTMDTADLAQLSAEDWQKLSSAVSLVRALIEYEIRECEEVFADSPNEESLNYWRECLQEADEASEILTAFRASAERRFA